MTTSKRVFPTILSLFILCTTTFADQKQPNVLFIAIDDLRTELGCYGVEHIQSPNLDRLASEGMLFNRHYVQVPTCGASRYSLLTGRSPHVSGARRGNNQFFTEKTQTNDAKTMPELFRRNGYKTVLIGKISHTTDGLIYNYDGTGDGRQEMPKAWDEIATPLGDWERGWGVMFAYANGRHREDGQGKRDLMEFVVEKDTDLPDGLNAEVAIEKLTEFKNSDTPFFLALGFYKPHMPFVAPRQDWEAMQKVTIPDATDPTRSDSAYWNKSGEFYSYDMPFPKDRPLAQADRIEARRAYAACVRYTDRQVGKVLDALDSLGLAESTIVVVWGDHGWQLGESALWAKHVPHERSLKSTFMMRVPGVETQKHTSDALVQSLDIYPTLVDLCNLENTQTEYPLDGKSIRPLLENTATSVNDVAISYWGNDVTVRDTQYRLIAQKEKDAEEYTDIELYNAEANPNPTKNIAQQHPEVTKRLMSYLP